MSFSFTSHSTLLTGAVLLAFAPAFSNSSTSRPHRAPAVTPKPALSEPAISPDRREIAFVAGGDIWTVPASGGQARLLVSHPAYDSRPLYSPDGARLAFISTRTGNGDIYVLTLATGQLRRLTFNDVNDQLDSWSRDGRTIYFSSTSKDISGMNDLYEISVDGGTPVQVSADRYANEYWSSPSPSDAHTLAFTGKGRTSSDWWRHGHSHIDESQIWLVHDGGATPTYEALTDDAAKDAWPMWSADGGTVYYVSDKTGSPNLWETRLAGHASRALTSFRDGRVLWPTASYDGKTIVFERNFGIWSYDVASNRAGEVPITLRGASAATGSEHLTLTQGFQTLALSPDGRKVAFTTHGDVFAASARDGGEAVRVTATPDLESDLAWAPDSRRLVYVSSRDGPTHLYLYDFGTRTETRLTEGPLNDITPVWSPDGSQLAYTRGARELRVIDMATKRDRLLAQGIFPRPPSFPEHVITWSPDGKWVGYLSDDADQFQNPHVVPAAGGEAHAVAFLPNVFGGSLAWSPDGTYLLFATSQRTEDGQIARVDLVPRTPRFREDQFRNLFREQPTRPGTPTEPAPQPQAPRRDTALVRGDSARDSSRARARARRPTRIVFDDIRRRTSIVPVGVNARGVIISPDGKTALLSASAAGQQNLYTYSLDELARGRVVARQLTSTPGNKSQPVFSPDGKEVYYLENGRIAAISVDSRQNRVIPVTAELDVDFDAQKMAVFHQAWSTLATNFFDPKMNGVDWKAVEQEYTPYVEDAASTEDLRRILRLMVGELNASHSGVNGPSFSPQANVGRLGVRFDRAEYERSGRLRVSEVLGLSPAAVSGVTVGDYLIAVDGEAIGPHTNLDSLLMYKIDRRVALTVSRGGTAAGSREVDVQPVNGATAKSLLYDDWVESRRAYVAKVSGGRLGYVHMADMSANALTKLYLDLDVENRSREGVVVDIRNNNGGFVNPYAIDVFKRHGYLNFTPRDFTASPGRTVVGQRSLEKPVVLVTNMHSLSDAEDFTEGWRALKIGPVVGDSTAGWIIFTSDIGLVDGQSSVRMPFERITDHNGEPMEMHPRGVDVLVRRPIGESYTGRDSQLDAAVAELLKLVGKNGSRAGGQ